jgi:hypothetical protein
LAVSGIFTQRRACPRLSPCGEQWQGLTTGEIIDVLDRHFDRCREFYTSGSGDQHFNVVQSAMRKAMDAKHPQQAYPPPSSRRRPGVRKVYNAGGAADAIDDREEDGESFRMATLPRSSSSIRENVDSIGIIVADTKLANWPTPVILTGRSTAPHHAAPAQAGMGHGLPLRSRRRHGRCAQR